MGDTILDVRIEKVEEEVNCVRVQRVEGSKLEFLRIFNGLRDTLIENELLI